MRKVKKPESKAAPKIIKMFWSSNDFSTSIDPLLSVKKCSTAVRELPMSRGTKREKTRDMMVITKPKRML